MLKKQVTSILSATASIKGSELAAQVIKKRLSRVSSQTSNKGKTLIVADD
jgi:hypothetical protein